MAFEWQQQLIYSQSIPKAQAKTLEAVICNAIALIQNQPSNLKDDHF